MIIPMRKLEVNQEAVIESVTAKGELGRRMRDMGLIRGTEIMVLHRAPLKDPVAIKIKKGYTITLRNSEADYITVETGHCPVSEGNKIKENS